MMREKCLSVEVFTWTSIILLAVEAARGSSTPPTPPTTQTPQQERPEARLNLNLGEADYIAIATFHKIAEQDVWINLLEQRIPEPLDGEAIANFKTKYGFTRNELLDKLVPPVKTRTILNLIKQGSSIMNATIDLMAPATQMGEKRWEKKDVYALFSGSLFACHVVESLGFGVDGKTHVSTDEIKSLINNRVSAPAETGRTRPRAGSDEATSRRKRSRHSRNPHQ